MRLEPRGHDHEQGSAHTELRGRLAHTLQHSLTRKLAHKELTTDEHTTRMPLTA